MRKADELSLMEFVGKDTRRVLASTGRNYANRLDNEDGLVMLMRKLPDEGLKKKWVHRAGDLTVREGRAEYADFVEFRRRVEGHINHDNRYGQELRSFLSEKGDKSESIKGKSERQPRVTTLATASDRT